MTKGILRRMGGEIVFEHCEIADTPLRRMRGLLGRSGLDSGQGMLFRPAGSIHMMFMRFRSTLSSHRDLVVVGVERDLKPCDRGRKGARSIELPVGGAQA